MVRERLIKLLSSGRARRVLLAIRAATQSPSISLVLISLFLSVLLALYAMLVWESGLLFGLLIGLLYALVYFIMTIVFGIIFYYKDNRELPIPNR